VWKNALHTAPFHYLPRKGKNRQGGKDALTIFLSGASLAIKQKKK